MTDHVSHTPDQDPEIDAAEIALGVRSARPRDLETEAVRKWQLRLMPLLSGVAPVTPPPGPLAAGRGPAQADETAALCGVYLLVRIDRPDLPNSGRWIVYWPWNVAALAHRDAPGEMPR